MHGSRKVDMLKHTQWMAFALTILFMAVKIVAPAMPIEVLVCGLAGVGVNFGAFVAGNVKGDHGPNQPANVAPPPLA